MVNDDDDDSFLVCPQKKGCISGGREKLGGKLGEVLNRRKQRDPIDRKEMHGLL